MLYDIFLFFNESRLFKARFSYLKDIVDKFVVYESRLTFSGNTKDKMFFDYFPDFLNSDKIEYVLIEGDLKVTDILRKMEECETFTDPYKSYYWKHGGKPLANLSSSFVREVYQRDFIGDWIVKNCGEQDTLILGDIDEIPSKEVLRSSQSLSGPMYLRQDWRLYFINRGVDKNWIGTKLVYKRHIAKLSVDLLVRDKEDLSIYNPKEIIYNGGWHLSSLGGIEAIRSKMYAYDYQGSRLKMLYKFLDRFGDLRIRMFLFLGRDLIDPRMRLIYKHNKLPTVFREL